MAYSPQTDSTWLNEAYQQFTGRPVDDAGAQYYAASGMDPYDIEALIASSPEAKGYETRTAQGLGLNPEWIDMLKNYGVNDLPEVRDTPAVPGKVRTDLTPLLSQQQALDKMVRAIYVESTLAKEPEDGELAVANTMFNRWMLNGNSLPQTPTYSTDMMGILNGSDYNGLLKQYQGKGVPEALNKLQPGTPTYDRLMGILTDRITGKLGDNTNGATHYYNPGISNPAWGVNGRQPYGNVQVIGNHTFMNQIPKDWYAEDTLPAWFRTQKPPTQQVDPNTFRADADTSIQDTMKSFDAYNSAQTQNMANIGGSLFSGGYQAQPAQMVNSSLFAGLNTPLLLAGYDGNGGGYSSGVSPTTVGALNATPGNFLSGGVNGGNSGNSTNLNPNGFTSGYDWGTGSPPTIYIPY